MNEEELQNMVETIASHLNGIVVNSNNMEIIPEEKEMISEDDLRKWALELEKQIKEKKENSEVKICGNAIIKVHKEVADDIINGNLTKVNCYILETWANGKKNKTSSYIYEEELETETISFIILSLLKNDNYFKDRVGFNIRNNYFEKGKELGYL